MIAPGVHYLIKSINSILREEDKNTYVSTSVDMYKSKDTGDTIIDFSYLLHIDGTTSKVIALASVKTDPEYYSLYKEQVLATLNDNFFKQILLHTNFTDTPNLLKISDSWRLN